MEIKLILDSFVYIRDNRKGPKFPRVLPYSKVRYAKLLGPLFPSLKVIFLLSPKDPICFLIKNDSFLKIVPQHLHQNMSRVSVSCNVNMLVLVCALISSLWQTPQSLRRHQSVKHVCVLQCRHVGISVYIFISLWQTPESVRKKVLSIIRTDNFMQRRVGILARLRVIDPCFFSLDA